MSAFFEIVVFLRHFNLESLEEDLLEKMAKKYQQSRKWKKSNKLQNLGKFRKN